MPDLRPLILRVVALLFLIGLAVPGTVLHAQERVVENTATLRWTAADGARSVPSNTVSLRYRRDRQPTSIGFRLLPPGYRLTGMACSGLPEPVFTPAPIDAATLAAAPVVQTLDIGQPMIIVLTAPGQNRDPTVREVASLDVDTGGPVPARLPLTETAPDSGVFAGGAPAGGDRSDPALADCALKLARGARLRVSFGGDEGNLPSEGGLLVDPVGFVFDSVTGAVINGATVAMVDDQGRPAAVFGDDGVTPYPSTMLSGAAVTDAAGRRYPAEPGRYRFPLVAPGRYHLQVTPPAGYVAPSAASPDALAKLSAPGGGALVINEASYGRGFELSTPDLFIADIPLDPDGAASLLLSKTASVREASPGDRVQYRLRVTNRGTAPARALHVADTLPAGLRYARGSTRQAGEPVAAADGRALDFTLPDLAPGASTELLYAVTVNPGAPVGEAVNRAVVRGAGIASNEAAAAVRLTALLFTDAMTIVGRVSEGDCGDPAAHRRGVAGVRLVLEDGTFVVTDRDGLYHLEGVRPGTHVVQMDRASIPATHEAVACDRDTRQARNPFSRFVEGSGGLLKRVDFQLRPTGIAAAVAPALPITVADDATAAGNRDWMTGQAPGIEWLFPLVDHNPRAPALRVVIKHHPGQRVALTLNGTAVDPISFDGSDSAGAVAVSRWTGLPLAAGDNRLAARVLNADGSVAATLARTVHLAGAPSRVAVVAKAGRLVADGLIVPLVAVRVTDAAGRPVRAGTPVPFRVAAPHAARIDAAQAEAQAPGTIDPAVGQARVVGDDGLAFLPLRPTTTAGAVHLTATLPSEAGARTVALDAWLAPGQRDWMVVGFGRGTVGFESLSRGTRALPGGGKRERITADGQLALYAKGRVRGDWLLTMAYDSDRPRDPTRGLLGTIDPNRYYTVYGDGSDQRYDAATSRKLFLRLERRQVLALFGDLETGLTDTQLTRYSRTLTGGKVAFESAHVRATAIVAETDLLHGRDEIQGNGLSGPYRLSRRNIVPNSDKLTIEVRDRFRSELIKSSTPLTRHLDYDIDAELGTLRFRRPVLSRDGNRDPIFIVADYEVEGGRGGRPVAAARVAARLADDRVTLGASAIHDETLGNATVAGLDLTLRADAATTVRAEAAGGGRGGIGRGLAYLAEVEHHGAALDLTAYVRRQDTAFGIGQQNLVEAGTRKTGLDARIALTPALTLTGTGWYQEQLGGPARRTAGEARLEWRRGGTTLFAGGQLAADRGGDGAPRDSRLLTLGGARAFLDERLVLTAQTQVAPGGDKASADFPVRHQLTASYRLRPGIRLIGGYEIADGATALQRTMQAGFDLSPWTGATLAATLNGQVIGHGGGEGGENARRTFAQYGLSQSLPLGARWTVDATLDAATTVSGQVDPGAVVTAFQPAASGGVLGEDARGGSFTAATLGAAYRGTLWRWNGRVEMRVADSGDRLGLTSNLVRALGAGRTLASSVRAYRLRAPDGGIATQASADVALAWRPIDSRWSLLDRLEVRHDRGDAGLDRTALAPLATVPAGTGQQATRIVNNLALNYRSGDEGRGHGTEATLYWGAKYLAGRMADDRYSGFIDALGADIRRDLGRRIDIGVQATASHAWSTGSWAWSAGPSAGISPARDLWITAGYNVAGYRDRDFEEDRYTRAGPYLTMRMKVDNLLFRRRAQ